MTASIVLSDTGPMSWLYKLGHLDVLGVLFGQVIIPPAVVAELEVGRRLGMDLPNISALDWIEVRGPRAEDLEGLGGLGAGETAALALARAMPGALLLVDDGAARARATELHIRITGTAGVLILAKERGLLAALAPELARLQQLGFRLAPRARALVLQLAGEEGA